MNNQTKLAWAAGFFDGEGHTSQLRRSSRRDPTITFYYPQIGVAQVDIRPLERFHAAVGGIGAIHKPSGTSPTHQYRATGSKAEAVMAMLWPYLSEPKKEQFARAKEGGSVEFPKHT